MASSSETSRSPFIVNFLATLGYICCLLQWLWAVILYIPLIEKSHVLQLLTPKPVHHPAPVHTAGGAPSPIIIIIAVVVTIIILGIIAYALAKVPVTIAKTGRKLTHDTAEKVLVPAITHHQKLPAKKKFRLTLAMSFIMKAVLLLVPFLLAVFAYGQSLPLGYDVIVVTAAFLAGVTAFFFAIQLLLIALLHPDVDAIW